MITWDFVLSLSSVWPVYQSHIMWYLIGRHLSSPMNEEDKGEESPPSLCSPSLGDR